MICITGVPGSGKTTLSEALSKKGVTICNTDEIAAKLGCLSEGEVDVDCLEKNADFSGYDFVESHYSHLLNCEHVIILECDEQLLRKRMERRGYSEHKILENIDAQFSGTIYYEALQRLPSNRIYTINTTDMEPGAVVESVMAALSKARKR